MDTLRVEESDKGREVNHHGKTITVGSDNTVAPSGEIHNTFNIFLTKQFQSVGKTSPITVDGETGRLGSSRYLMSRNSTMNNTRLVSRDEQEMVEARREFYKNVGSEKDLLKTGEWIGKKGIPIFVAIFCIIYWGYGLSHYFY